jgi:hypothetical protein
VEVGSRVSVDSDSKGRHERANGNSKRPSKWVRGAAAYVAIVVLCLIGETSLLRLNNANLAIPINAHWDAYFYTALIKNIVENNGYYVNPALGAPGEQQSYDFPQPHATHWLGLKLLSFVSKNYAVVLNAYFLLTFPLIAILSLVTFRQFGVSYPLGILGGTLFAFLPYHLIRAESHLPYSSFYMVPPMVLVLLWLCAGEQFFGWDSPQHSPFVSRKGIAALCICVLLAGDTAYAAFFGSFFLLVAVAVSRWRYGHHRLRSGSVLLGTLLLAFTLNLVPTFLYRARHGFNPQAVQRSMQESEIYGLKIAQLVLPVTGHRLKALAHLKDLYNQRGMPYWVTENDWSSLGVLGGGGFLLLLGFLLFKPNGNSGFDLLDSLSLLNISGVLLGTVGGFGAIFAVLVSPEIRGYTRISVFIAYFSLFAIVAVLDKLFQSSSRMGRFVAYPAVGLLLVVCVLDETIKAYAPDHQALQKEFAADDDFIKRVEGSLPKGSMIFQLPYVAFPASAPVNRMYDYDHLRAYLHSKNLRWSYGAMRGRDIDAWQASVSGMKPNDMAETLVLAGFRGIYLNRDGYADRGAALQSDLTSLLEREPLVSQDQRLLFFALDNMEGKLRRKYPGEAWQVRCRIALASLQEN